jgi:hypothetical protein
MKLKKRAVRTLRRVVGDDSAVETTLRKLRNRAQFRTSGLSKQTTYVVFRGDETRIGVYGFGGCDTWAIAESGPWLRRTTTATGAAWAAGRAQYTRSDLMLQAIDGVDLNAVAEVSERLQLERPTFQPVLLEPRFTVPGHEHLGSFPKDVVVLTISSDLSRILYRHKEHGFLVDPGGFWLSADIKDALGDLDTVKWFAKHFEKTGRTTVDQTMSNMERLVTLIRQRLGAEVVFFNCLTVDPGRQVFDYKLSHSPHRTRRREFGLALVELSRKMDFSIVDADRILKGVGVSGLGDFVKYMPEHKKAIAAEFVRVLREREVFG